MIANNWPQQPQDDLRIDTAWRENYSGASMNRKFAGVVPPGIYNGFKVVVDDDTPLTVLVGDVDESIAVVESQGFSLTARMPAGMKKTLTLKAGATQHILLQVDYQQQKVSTVELVTAPDVLPNSVLLATLNVPSNADRLTAEMIDYSQRIDRITVLDHEQKADPHSQYYPKTGGAIEGNIWCKGKITVDEGLHFQAKALISAAGATDNFDHIWHDDVNGGANTDLNGAWHFCSDAPELRSPGNSRIQAGSYSLAHKGKLTHLKTGDTFSGFSSYGLTIVTEHGRSSIGMNNGSYCHFSTEAGSFYFDKTVVVKGEIYAGPGYNRRVFHEGDQTDAINDSSSSKLATAKAVKTAYAEGLAANTAINAHTQNTNNPHRVTKAQVGLGNLPNVTTDAINDNSSNKLATARAVKTVNDEIKKLSDIISSAQFLPYLSHRVYRTGEICYTQNAETGELSYWQWYSNIESLAGKDPLDPLNRHIQWTDNTKPFYWIPYTGDQVGIPFYWLDTVAPEYAIMEIGEDLPVTVYWRLARRYPTLVSNGVINTGDIRGEFIRVLDQGRDVDKNRQINSAQSDAIRNITGTFDTNYNFVIESLTGALQPLESDVEYTPSERRPGVRSTTGGFNFDASKVVPTANENRPRNIVRAMAIHI